MRTQLPAIRERLLDGMLVREGIVDRPALEQSLNERNLMCGRDYTRLLQLLDTEAWAQHWLSRLPRPKGPPVSLPPRVLPLPGGADPAVTRPAPRTSTRHGQPLTPPHHTRKE